MEHYDITIIGGGSGGLTAARTSAALGARVLLVDKERLGGDCLWYGCVPSKSLIHVAKVAQQVRDAAALGLVTGGVEVDMAKASVYVQEVIGRIGEAERIYTEGVTVKFGRVAFASSHELELNGERINSRNTIIATGSRPAIPPVEGLTEIGYLTNEDVFDLARLPASIIVVGGGPVGVELSQALRRLGVRVTILQEPARILPREDAEVSQAVADALQSEGVEIVTNARFVRASRDGDKKVVTAKRGNDVLSFKADEIVLALGRQPDMEGLNLEAAAIQYDAGGIKVNEYLQTTAGNVLAVGDVIGGYLFTHIAAYQAGIATRNALVPIAKKKVDYRVVPWCTFTDPEAARVGLTSDEAEKRYKQTRVVKFPWADIDRAQTEGATAGFIKLVLAGKKDEIVGAHLVGARAGELLGELSLAMRHNLTLNDILDTIHVYPTMSTGIQQAVFEAYLESSAIASNRKLIRAVSSLRGKK